MDNNMNYNNQGENYLKELNGKKGKYKKVLPLDQYKTFSERAVEVSKAYGNKEYHKAYDLAEKLYEDLSVEGSVYGTGNRDYLLDKILKMMEKQYANDIIEKYKIKYREILDYGSVESYISSGYPGSIQDYARNKAIEEIISLYAKTRFGGYMHKIVIRVIKSYINIENMKDKEADIQPSEER